jgi:hypothetical protein
VCAVFLQYPDDSGVGDGDSDNDGVINEDDDENSSTNRLTQYSCRGTFNKIKETAIDKQLSLIHKTVVIDTPDAEGFLTKP